MNDVNAAALQWKSLIGKIPDRRREIQFAVEPGFYRVLIGRNDIGEMPGLQRSQMGIDNLLGKHCFIVAATVDRDDSPAAIGNQKKCRGDCEPSPRPAEPGR